jgi:hypothetical protein
LGDEKRMGLYIGVILGAIIAFVVYRNKMSDFSRGLYGDKEEKGQGCLPIAGFVLAFIAAITQTIFFIPSIGLFWEYPEVWVLIIPAPIIWIGIILAWKKPIFGGLVFIAVSLLLFLSPQISPELSKGDFAGLAWMLIWGAVCIPLLISGILFLILGIRQRQSPKQG